MKKNALLLCLLFAVNLLYAQEKVFFPTEERTTEIGLNATSVISSFVDSNNGSINPGDYPLVVKIAKNNKAWRFGLGLDFKSQRDDNSITFGATTTSESSVFMKIGREWRHLVAKRVVAYYGIDVLGNWISEHNEVFTSTDLASLNLNNIGFGGGPVYGLQIALSERMLVSFEGSLYGVVTRSHIKETFEQNPIFNKNETVWLSDVKMNMPQWLYLIVRF